MALATLQAVVDALTSTVDYLRVSVDAPGEDWLPCEALCTDAVTLHTVVATTKSANGISAENEPAVSVTERAAAQRGDTVAMSLFVQGYVFRAATVLIGGWLLDDVIVGGAPGGWSMALGRGRPNAVRLAGDVPVSAAASVGDVHGALIDGHLAVLIDTAHEACRVGRALLWGNVAASCAAAFGAFAAARPGVGERAEEFFAAARPDVRDAGRLVRVGERFAWERRSCCLWYRTDSGFMCEDCSLRPAAEHEARCAAMAAEVWP